MSRTPDTQTSRTTPELRALGARLREMFESVAAGPMPEHLVDLVDQLERIREGSLAEAGIGECRSLVAS